MRLIKNFKRKAPTEIALHIIVSVFFLAVAFSYIYVLAWSFLSAVRTNDEIILAPFKLPETWHWRNFIVFFSEFEVKGNNFFDMLGNSIYFSVVHSFISIFSTMLFAYCCTKYKFFGSEWPYTIILITSILPIFGVGGANYKLVHSMGLIDSYWRVILGIEGFNMNFLYFRALFKSMSWTYAESAMMDGANDFQICYKVMLPQAKPLFGALFLTSWLGGWNDYKSALVYIPNLPTLPVGIYHFEHEMAYLGQMEVLFAAIFIVSVPPIILFMVFNKTITTNVSLGGIKG